MARVIISLRLKKRRVVHNNIKGYTPHCTMLRLINVRECNVAATPVKISCQEVNDVRMNCDNMGLEGGLGSGQDGQKMR